MEGNFQATSKSNNFIFDQFGISYCALLINDSIKTAKKDPDTVNKIAFILLFISYLGLIELISLQYLF